jgi:ComEC/Rec2-related protein
MEKDFVIRNGDIAFVFAVAFILGVGASTFNWSVPAIFALLIFCGAATLLCCRSLRRFWQAIVATLLIFLFAVEYYHLFAQAQQGNRATPIPQVSKNGAIGFPSTVFNAMLPSRQSELLTAIVSGSTGAVDSDLKSQMSVSGTSYIVGMYGYKINLFAAALFAAGRRFFPRRIALAMVVFAVLAFIFMAGAPISAIRAGIMMGLVSLARESGRLFRVRNVFTFTAVIMLLSDPTLLGSASFQLSFLSLLGIFMLGPPCRQLFRATGQEFLQWKAHAIMALSVNAAIMPLVMLQFGDFSITSFISNFLIAIPLAAVIGLALVVAALGFLSPHLAFLVAALANVFLSYQLSVIKFFSVVVVPLPLFFQSGFFVALYYFLLTAFIIHYGTQEKETTENI